MLQAGPGGGGVQAEASPYREVGGKTLWVKVKNPAYTQAEGRRHLFDGRRG